MATTKRSAAALARRVGNGVVTTVVVLVILVCAAWLLPSAFGYERYVITGGSMSGAFDKGSIAFEEEIPVEQLRVGDVITYQPPASSGIPTLVTHRIVGIRPWEDGRLLMRTKGDANDSRDPWRFSLTGSSQPVVRWTVPYVGYAFVALADRELRMLLIGVPAALIGIIALKDLVIALRRNRPAPAPAAVIPAQASRRPAAERTPA
jgi:signal peptidase